MVVNIEMLRVGWHIVAKGLKVGNLVSHKHMEHQWKIHRPDHLAILNRNLHYGRIGQEVLCLARTITLSGL